MAPEPRWNFPRGIGSVALLVDFAREHGMTAQDALRGSMIPPARLHEEAADVRAEQELAVVRNVMAGVRMDPRLAALRLATRYHLTSYGIWGYALLSSRTVADAVAVALRYIELTYVFCVPDLILHGDRAILRCTAGDLPPDVRPFLVTRDLAAICTLFRDVLGAPPAMRRVDLPLAEPAESGPYRAVFGLAPRFGCDEGALEVDADFLAKPLPQANEHTARLAEEQCRQLLAQRAVRGGVAGTVRDRLLKVDGPIVDMREVAAELGVTTRTLRRKLAEEGTSFRALSEEVRETVAVELLSTGALSVEQVALRLGYAESASFIHAFKRWKGVTPSAYARGRRPGKAGRHRSAS